MHRTIDAYIDIDARPEKVWEVLVDFKSWESWNAVIPLAQGNLKAGERMLIKVVSPGLKPMFFKPKFLLFVLIKKLFGEVIFSRFYTRGSRFYTYPNCRWENPV